MRLNAYLHLGMHPSFTALLLGEHIRERALMSSLEQPELIT